MGIKLGGSETFDIRDYQVLQSAAKNNLIHCDSVEQLIDYINEINNIQLIWDENNQAYDYNYKEIAESPIIKTDVSNYFSNIVMEQSTIIGDKVGPVWDADDSPYTLYETPIKIVCVYGNSLKTLISMGDNIWTNNARVIYHRKRCKVFCDGSTEDDWSVKVIFEYKLKEIFAPYYRAKDSNGKYLFLYAGNNLGISRQFLTKGLVRVQEGEVNG